MHRLLALGLVAGLSLCLTACEELVLDDGFIPADACEGGSLGVISGDDWVVCDADRQTAWVSANSNGTYDAPSICRFLGYDVVREQGGTCGDVCGYCASSSCSSPGPKTFDGGGGPVADLNSTVMWNCEVADHDYNIDFGEYETPDEDYGAAGGGGQWYTLGLPNDEVLRNVAGRDLGARITVNATTGGGSAGRTPPDGYLLGDNFYSSSTTFTMTITGLAPSDYRLYIYAPNNGSVPTGNLNVNGVARSSIPGDLALIQNTSYIVTTTTVGPAGTLTIIGTPLTQYAGLSGLQIRRLP